MTRIRTASLGVRAKVSRMNSTWSALMRPSLNVNERAVLMPSTATPGQLDEGAQALVDEAPVARQRRKEAAQHVVQRNVVVSGNTEHLVPTLPQAFEELACLAKLLGACALGEIAADHDQVGLQLVDLPLDSLDQTFVMRAEMKVGKMDDAGHGHANAVTRRKRSEIQEQQQLDVDPEAFGALLLDEIRRSRRGGRGGR